MNTALKIGITFNGRLTAVATDNWGVSIEKDRAGEIQSVFIEGKRSNLTATTWRVVTGTTAEGWPSVYIFRTETQY